MWQTLGSPDSFGKSVGVDIPPPPSCVYVGEVCIGIVLVFSHLAYGSQSSFTKMPFQKYIFPCQKKTQYRRFSQFGNRMEFPNKLCKFNICFKKLDFTNMYILNCILSLCSTSKNNSNFIL